VTNVFKIPSVREKIRNTMMERYGGTNTLDSPGLRHKYDFSAMAKKRHETMKREGNYKQSKEEIKFGTYLERFGNVQRNVIIDGRWPIDFYLIEHNAYIQYDGIYWHGLDRSIDIIKESKNKRDIVIYQKWMTDREQEKWFAEHDMKLVRIRSDEFQQKECKCQRLEDLLNIKLGTFSEDDSETILTFCLC